jgi:hypothetical protein
VVTLQEPLHPLSLFRDHFASTYPGLIFFVFAKGAKMTQCNNNTKQPKKKYKIKDVSDRKILQRGLVMIENRLSSMKSNLDFLIHKALFELLLGMSEKTIESAKQVLTIDETSFLGWYYLGCGYLDENKIVYAKTAYENALRNTCADADEINEVLVDDIFDSLKMIAILENNEGVS